MKKYCPGCRKDFPGAADTCPACDEALLPLPEDALVGTILDGRYQVSRIIGRGGMGMVYAARQKYLDRQVALKVLRAELSSDETFAKRFLREARVIASLKNPHTITLHDFGISEEGRLYFAMEMLNGRPLSELIQRHAPLHPAQAAEVLGQACESLQEAHNKGLLHRDLKPDNLFLSRTPDDEVFVTVLDFGIAKSLTDAEEHLTGTGVICGTPHYVSPEQAAGDDLDPRTDLYSLGIILYEMLTGALPFQDPKPVRVLLKQMEEDPVPIRRRRPELKISPAVDEFVLTALAKDPGRRPQTAREFADGLKAAATAPEQPEPTGNETSMWVLERGQTSFYERQTPPPEQDEGATAAAIRRPDETDRGEPVAEPEFVPTMEEIDIEDTEAALQLKPPGFPVWAMILILLLAIAGLGWGIHAWSSDPEPVTASKPGDIEESSPQQQEAPALSEVPEAAPARDVVTAEIAHTPTAPAMDNREPPPEEVSAPVPDVRTAPGEETRSPGEETRSEVTTPADISIPEEPGQAPPAEDPGHGPAEKKSHRSSEKKKPVERPPAEKAPVEKAPVEKAPVEKAPGRTPPDEPATSPPESPGPSDLFRQKPVPTKDEYRKEIFKLNKVEK